MKTANGSIWMHCGRCGCLAEVKRHKSKFEPHVCIGVPFGDNASYLRALTRGDIER